MANAAVTVGGAAARSLSFHSSSARVNSHLPLSAPLSVVASNTGCYGFFPKLSSHYSGEWHHRPSQTTTIAKSSSEERNSLVPSDDAEEGVLLGTMKLPSDTDVPRFQILLFQWANSLCQGANLPLAMPLKVDKIAGGTRLGFITIGDGETEVPVYIDCLVFPASADSGPVFRAVRNGRLKDKTPPGEPRIMRSLMMALQKSVQIARV